MTSSEPEEGYPKATWLIVALLIAACLLIYGQTFGFGFINLDDNLYVYDNSIVESGLNASSLKWAFTAFYSANWHPLTWISHMLDTTLFGVNAGASHAVNVLFHAANSIVAFIVFKRLTGDVWKKRAVAFLFAVHPAHVESVAWISERKDVLSTLFWLLTMLAYARYARADPSDRKWYQSTDYALVVVFFVLGLMAKPMLVTLPFVLLLVDFWPLKRMQSIAELKPLLLEKLPLFGLSIVSSYITIAAQTASGAIESFQTLSLGSRSVNAANSYLRYISMFVYPRSLAVWYPLEPVSIALAIGAVVFLIAVTALFVRMASKRRYLIVGWLWFLGTLVPVIGIVQVGGQALADRYTYVPYFGLFIIAVWGGSELMDRLGLKASLQGAVAAVVILAFGVAAFVQAGYWRDSESLYVRTLSVTRGNFLIAHNLCYFYVFAERYDEAGPLCEQSIAINPNYVDARNTLGIMQLKQNKLEDAEKTLRDVLDRRPYYLPAYANLATALILEKKPEEAEKYLERATLLAEGQMDRSTWTEPVKNLADLYVEQGKIEKAAENYRRAVFLDPNRADLRMSAARTLFDTKSYDDALINVQSAITLDPGNADAYFLAGKILVVKGMRADAAKMFEKAVQIRPDFAEAKLSLSQIKGAEKQ